MNGYLGSGFSHPLYHARWGDGNKAAPQAGCSQRFCKCTQLEFLNFAGCGLGQFLEDDRLGGFEPCERASGMGD